MITIESYLDIPAPREDVASATDYYAVAATMTAADEAAVLERGRQAGLALGADWARLSVYLQTRIFELVVHGNDIAAATGLSFNPPDDALESAVVLAAQIAVTTGQGTDVLMALTGRRLLPPGFCVV